MKNRRLTAWPAGTADGQRHADRPSSFFSKVSSDYLLVVDSAADVSCEPHSLQRLFTIARDTGAGFIYSDFLVATANSLVRMSPERLSAGVHSR